MHRIVCYNWFPPCFCIVMFFLFVPFCGIVLTNMPLICISYRKGHYKSRRVCIRCDTNGDDDGKESTRWLVTRGWNTSCNYLPKKYAWQREVKEDFGSHPGAQCWILEQLAGGGWSCSPLHGTGTIPAARHVSLCKQAFQPSGSVEAYEYCWWRGGWDKRDGSSPTARKMEMRWFHYIRFGFIQHIQHIKKVPLTISEALFVIYKRGTMIWGVKRLSSALWISNSFERQCTSLSGVVVSPLKTRLPDNQHLPSLMAAIQAQTWSHDTWKLCCISLIQFISFGHWGHWETVCS